MIDLTLATIILLVALATGILSATVGVGGGFIMVSFMIAYMGLTTQKAVGTSAFVIIFSAISASVAYFRQRRVDYKIGALAACFSIPAAFIGGYATKYIPSAQLALLFAIALLMVGIRMILFPKERGKDVGPRDEKKGHVNGGARVKSDSSGKPTFTWKRRIVDAAGHSFVYESRILPAIPFFFLAGLLSGLFGVGGGIVIVPTLQVIAGIPMHLAVATSMFTMIFTSISSATTHILIGNVEFEYAIFLVIGIIVGAQVGARVAGKMKSSGLERLFGVTMLLISIYLVVTKALAP